MMARASVGWFIVLMVIIAILLLILIIACIVYRSRGDMYPGQRLIIGLSRSEQRRFCTRKGSPTLRTFFLLLLLLDYRKFPKSLSISNRA